MIMSRRGAVTFGFTFLHPASSFENNFWIGFANRTTREVPETERVVRLVYEYLGHGLPRVIAAARIRGLQNEEVLPPLHRRYLQPDRPFR